MRRGFSHSATVALGAKWLLRDLRFGTVLERSQASKSSSFGSASPVASSLEGTQQCQNYWPCFFSTQCQPVKQEGPDISLLEPALQKQWDHAANAHLGKLSSNHTPKRRSSGRDCPQCSGRKLCKHNSLATKAPVVAARWDYEAKSGTPDDVVANTHQAFGWWCDVCGGKWKSSPDQRVRKGRRGCPHYAALNRTKNWTRHPTFAECKHPLLAEWDQVRNTTQGYFQDQTRLQSSRKIWWLCDKCPAGQEHSWSARASSRTGSGKTGCPCCAGLAACKCNSLQALHPDIAAEWDHDRNTGQPSNYPASSTHFAWWSSCQHSSWEQTITSRTGAVYQRSARLKRIQQRQHFEPVP
ncbi:hypothetical protein ABBQ38_008162 [Trebouxia sp. C0009 RCD-2024]